MYWCTINIDDTLLKVNSSGDIKRRMKSGNWKNIENIRNHINGMNVIVINKKYNTRSFPFNKNTFKQLI